MDVIQNDIERSTLQKFLNKNQKSPWSPYLEIAAGKILYIVFESIFSTNYEHMIHCFISFFI